MTLVGGIGTFDKLQEETRSLGKRDRQCDPVEENKNCLAISFFLLPPPPPPAFTSTQKLNIGQTEQASRQAIKSVSATH